MPLLVASAALAALARAHDTFPGDRPLTAWAQEIGDWYAPVAFVFNSLDLLLFALLVLAALWRLAARRHFEAAGVTLAVALARPLLGALKEPLGRPRPGHHLDVPDAGWDSFPSGHTMTAAACFGAWLLFAPLLVRRSLVLPVRAAALVGIVLMALSRMWAGDHWLSDTYGAVVWIAAAFAIAISARALLGTLVEHAYERIAGLTGLAAR